jgi:thiopurine S-methyltransferase
MDSRRDNALWRQCWRDRHTVSHQLSVNPLLARFWPGLELAPGSRVLVPLCGKSLDMLWLAEQGHEVVGVELSPVAVSAFFRENHLQPVRRAVGKFIRWQHGRLSILCGDFFSLTASDLGDVDAVYDRAALTALAPGVREAYVAHLHWVLPAVCKVFLLTIEDAQDGETTAQSRAVADEIGALYSHDFDFALAHVESVFEVDPDALDQAPERSEHKLYRLSPKPRPC